MLTIDTRAAERDSRVRAIVRAVSLDQPAYSVVRYAGQPVVAIAATSMAAAEDALRLIRVDYKPLPFVVDMDEALWPDSAKVYDAASAPGNSVGEIVAQAGLPLEGNVRGPAGRAAATLGRALRARTSSSRANTARRCRRIAAWSRTASSPIGDQTD